MNFTLVKGDMAHLDEYRAIFFDSKLYDAYFAEDDRLEKSLPTVLRPALCTLP